jgi:alkylated DNA repair dioxygenase AlkB
MHKEALKQAHTALSLKVVFYDLLAEICQLPFRKSKGQKKKEEKYELALPEQNKPYRVEQTVFVYKKKKKNKGGNGGDDAGPRERARCGCQARLHQLVNNCVRCGRIVCTKEGAGPCFQCEAMVYAVSGEVAENVAAVAALESGASQKELAGLQKAQEHLGRLLEYDQNAVRRTTVYDDQADYFDMSKWLSDDERKVLKEKEESIIREKEARKNMITIDFAGRKVVTEEAEALKFEEEVVKQIVAGAHVAQKKAEDSLLFNPSAMASTGVRPTFIGAPTSSVPSSANDGKQKKKRKLTDDDEDGAGHATASNVVSSPKATEEKPTRSYARAVVSDVGKTHKSRVQHEFYPETDVQLAALDFDEIVAADLTPLTNAALPLERRGVIFQKPLSSAGSASAVIQWMSSKKANVLVLTYPISADEEESPTDSLKLKDVNDECRAAGLVLCVGFHVPVNFEYGSEEAVARVRSQIHDLAHKHGVVEFAFFFSGQLSAPSGFRSLAQAQCNFVNATVRFFDRSSADSSTPALSWTVAPSRSFCSFDAADADTTSTLLYLRELDAQMNDAIVLLWNGPHKLPRKIHLDYLKKQKGLIRHKTVLWERSPAKGSSLHGGSVLSSYNGRPSEIGCFSLGVMLSVDDVGDKSWMPFVGSALTFAASPTTFSAADTFKTEIFQQFDRKSDLVAAALEVVEAAPASFLRERISPPSCLRLGSRDEVDFFSRRRLLSEKLLKNDKGDWAKVAEYVFHFSKANELFASFESSGRKADYKARVALTHALRTWGQLIEPHSGLIKPLKSSLFLHQIPEKSFVQEIQANYFKWEQQVALIKSERSSRIPRIASTQPDVLAAAAQKIKELELMLVEDLHDLEVFLIDAYNDDDLQAMRDYLNTLHFDSAVKRIVRPPLTSGLARQLDRAALDRFVARLQRRRADAAKKVAQAVSAVPDAPTESDKCEEVKTPVPGLRYFKNWVSLDEETTLLRDINSYPWSSTLHRRTQQYGYIYDYGAVKNQDVSDSRLSMGPMMPPSLQRLADRLYKDKLSPAKADQCIVNEYLPGQGINPHIDHAASFQDCIVSVSLGSDVVMDFNSLKADEEKHILLQRRSAIILTGDSRYNWQHGIAAREVDQLNGRDIRRTKRISITFRKVSQQAIQAITKASKR